MKTTEARINLDLAFEAFQDEEISEEELLEAISQLEDKVDGWGAILEKIKIEEAGAKARLDEALKRYKIPLDRLKSAGKRIEEQLVYLHSIGVFEDETHGKERTLRFRNYPKVEVYIDPEKLPIYLQKVKVEADKNAIKKAIEEGEGLDEIAEIVPNPKPQFGWVRRVQ